MEDNFTGVRWYQNGQVLAEMKFDCPILDNIEKKYLRNVIRPFKQRIKSISKKTWMDDREYLTFDLKDECSFTLATFKKGTMYKGMELRKEYTLKELGL